MTPGQLEGLWINGHIRELLEQKAAEDRKLPENGKDAVSKDQESVEDPTAQALKNALRHAERVVEAARFALRSYVESSQANSHSVPYGNRQALRASADVAGDLDNSGDAELSPISSAQSRRGPTSRELSGEMGGDTAIAA
jgi:hypothetical protein